MNSPSFARRVNILEIVVKVHSSVVMLDLKGDELLVEMFHRFF
jgi:hypothetical protein